MALFRQMFWRILLPGTTPGLETFPSVDVIIPARNEALSLPLCLPSLLKQSYAGPWRVLLIDDHSNDGTTDVAQRLAETSGFRDKLQILPAPTLPVGWKGKVAAMNAGFAVGNSDYVLFTDADIKHATDSIDHLVRRAEERKLDLVSRMVMLNCSSFIEKLLIPAFVFFFAMLYPFRGSNDPLSKSAAAAGGTMLVRRATLKSIGGLSCIRSALIDDCSLAKAIKSSGGRIELTMTRSIESTRPYPNLEDVWSMIARTAYTQLHYSRFLVSLTICGMLLLYVLPLLLIVWAPTLLAFAAGTLSVVVMTAIYVPMVRFYGLSWVWALTLPAAASIYALATIDSALRFYRGIGGEWKGRAQA